MADGRLNKCIECAKSDVKSNRIERKEHYQEYDRRRGDKPDRVAARRAYAKTAEGKASADEAKAKWARENRIKRRAQNAVSNAVRDGRISKQLCFICGSVDAEAHHADYDRPLDVTWLCDKHHKLLHKEHRESLRQIEKSSTRVST